MAEKEKKDNFFKKIGRYFKSIGTEMKRVSWPTKKQLITSTISVIIYCIIIGAVIAALDMLVGQLLLGNLLGLRP